MCVNYRLSKYWGKLFKIYKICTTFILYRLTCQIYNRKKQSLLY